MNSGFKKVISSKHFESENLEHIAGKVIIKPAGLSGAQVALLALILGGLLGVAGLISLCLMVWFSHQRFGVDSSAKHGISARNTSRMGGIAIALFLVIAWLATIISPGILGESYSTTSFGPSFVLLAGLLACVGLLDDMGIKMTPVTRLLITSLILTFSFVLAPAWMPNRLLVDFGLPSFWIDFCHVVLSVFVCVGFINAGNIADGANGLFSGICLGFFICIWLLTANNFYFSMSLGLLSFFLINVLTGRIIMGDFGAYGLSALIALTGFNVYDQELVSLGFLATLLCYPCLEIVRIFAVRVGKGESPLRADNQHSHNELNEYFLNFVKSKTFANSLTGVSIAIFSVSPAFIIFFYNGQRNEVLCSSVFGAQCVLFVLAHMIAHEVKLKRKPVVFD